MGKLAVSLKASGSVIDGSVFRRVGIAFFNQGVNHIQHTVDFLGCLGVGGGGFYIHDLHILFALRNVALGNDGGVHPFFHCLFDNLIVHIGKV